MNRVLVGVLLLLLSSALPFAASTCKQLYEADPNLIRCNCTESILNCTNKGLVSAVVHGLSFVTQYLPNVEEIILTGNSIRNLTGNLFGSCSGDADGHLQKLRKLDLSNNEIKYIPGKTFHCVANLQELDLSDNMWYVDPKRARVFSNLQTLKKLYLKNSFGVHKVKENLDHLQNHTINLQLIFNVSGLTNLEELHLEDNSISRIADNTFCDLHSLKALFLNNNDIGQFEIIDTVPCLTHLEELHLEFNAINSLSLNAMDRLEKMNASQKLARVNLSYNQFLCDCNGNMPQFVSWVQSNQSKMLIDREHMLCMNSYPINMTGVTLKSVTIEQLDDVCQSYNYGDHVNSAYVVIGIIFGLIAVALVVAVYINRSKLRQTCGFFLDRLRKTCFGRAHHGGYSTVNI